MSKPTIFLDIDGVLTDFEGHARAGGKMGLDGKLDYERLDDHEWWVRMPAYDGARNFYNDVKRQGTVKFLTGPVMTPACYSGKAAWLSLFLKSKWSLRDLIICPSKDKSLLARTGRILIDDRAENVKAWNDAGGVGIHHKGDYQQTLRQLEKAVLRIRKPKGPGCQPP